MGVNPGDGLGRSGAGGRPKIPWLKVILLGGGAPATPGRTVARLVGFVLVVLNPVAALVGFVASWVGLRLAVRVRWLALGAGVVTVPVVVGGWSRRYFAVWGEVGQVVGDGFAGMRFRQGRVEGVGGWSEVVARLPGWALVMVPFAVCLGGWVAVLVVWYRGRYVADFRRRPQEVSAKAIDRARAAVNEPGPVARRVDDLVVKLGVDVTHGHVVQLEGQAFRQHMVIGGPTGSGKTTTLMRVIDQVIGQGAHQGLPVSLVSVDMKGDRGYARFLRTLAQATGRRMWHITVERGQSRYNPLADASADEIRSLLIEAEANAADGGFSEPHYKRLGERLLLLAAQVLDELVAQGRQIRIGTQTRAWRKDLGDLVRLMDVTRLARNTDQLSDELAGRVRQYADEVAASRNLADQTYGLYNRYRLIQDGPAGTTLDGGRPGLVLGEAISRGDIVLFSLDAAADQATARQLGNLVIQDITLSLARLGRTGWTQRAGLCLIAVDEFSALGGSLLASLFARARSLGGGVILSSQDLQADLSGVSDQFRSQVLTNANVAVLHRQKGDAAGGWAETIGTEQVWRETLQTTDDVDFLGQQTAASGVGSLREVDEFIIHPNTLKTLPVGQAVILADHPHPIRAITDIAAPTTRTPVAEHPGHPGGAAWWATPTAPTPQPAPGRWVSGPDMPPVHVPAQASTLPTTRADVIDADGW